jgi:hypothetical protein
MDTELMVLTMGYIVYNVLLNWMYIREYLMDTNKGGVINRGHEWDNE